MTIKTFIPDHLLNKMPGWMWIICTASLLLIIGLGIDISPWLRGDIDFRYPYNAPAGVSLLMVVAVIILAGYIALAVVIWRWATRGHSQRRVIAAIAFAVIMSVVIPMVVLWISDRDPIALLLFRTSLPHNGGFWDVAMKYSQHILDFMTRFTRLNSRFNPHAQRHPPGLILMFMGFERVFEAMPGVAAFLAGPLHAYQCDFLPAIDPTDAQYAASLIGLLSPLVTALGIIPLFAAVRLLADDGAALGVALLSPLVPSYTFNAGVWDPAFVLVTGLLLWLLVLALDQKRVWAWALAGGLLSAATFFSHAMLVLIAFAGAYTILSLWKERGYWLEHKRRVLLGGLSFVLALSAVWIIYWLVTGITFVELYRATTEPHFEMSMNYVSRLFYNPFEFVTFLGFPIGFVMVAAAWKTFSPVARRQPLFSSKISLVVAAFLLTFVALVLSGVARASVGRVWIFLMPLGLLTAFAVADGLAKPAFQWGVVAALLAAQLLVLQITMSGYMPLEGYMPRPIYQVTDPYINSTPSGVHIDQNLALAAYTAKRKRLYPGSFFIGQFFWQTLSPSATRYQVSLVAHSAQPEPDAAATDYPIAAYETQTCPRPGDILHEGVTVDLPPDILPGDYLLDMVVTDSPASDNPKIVHVPLGTITVSTQ